MTHLENIAETFATIAAITELREELAGMYNGQLHRVSHYGALSPGSSRAYWRDLSPCDGNGADDGEWFTHAYLSYSPYDNSTFVERSNVRAFLQEFEGNKGVVKVLGDGGRSIALHLAYITPEMVEFIGALESYCVADEELMSEMEIEASQEAWEDWGRHDFCHAMKLEGVPDKIVDQVFEAAREKAGLYWEAEAGSMHIDLEKVAKHAARLNSATAI